MTTKEQYHLAYQILRSLQSHGFAGTYWGDNLLSGIRPEIIGMAAISLASRYQADRRDRRFVMRCQVASPRYSGGKLKWVFHEPDSDGIPF